MGDWGGWEVSPVRIIQSVCVSIFAIILLYFAMLSLLSHSFLDSEIFSSHPYYSKYPPFNNSFHNPISHVIRPHPPITTLLSHLSVKNLQPSSTLIPNRSRYPETPCLMIQTELHPLTYARPMHNCLHPGHLYTA